MRPHAQPPAPSPRSASPAQPLCFIPPPDNWAFLYAQRLALKQELPLRVCFCLVPKFLGATIRHYGFMLRGLQEVSKVRPPWGHAGVLEGHGATRTFPQPSSSRCRSARS